MTTFDDLQFKGYEEDFVIPETGMKIEIGYRNNSMVVAPEIKALALEFLQSGYSYLSQILGEDSLLGKKNMLRLKNSGSHGTAGVDIDINVNSLADKDRAEFEQSQIIHEIIHHTVEQEHLPIFIELIYMLEKNQQWRFEDLDSLFAIPRFREKNRSYVKGFNQIVEWLGFSDLHDLFTKMPKMELSNLKRVFKEKYDEYCHQDEVLACQMTNTKRRLIVL